MRFTTPQLPQVETLAELEALRADPSRWQPSVGELSRELGLGDQTLRDLGGGNLVIAIGVDHVLKLTPPAFAREVEAERVALTALAGRCWPAPICAPELLGCGTWRAWPWVLVRALPGVTLASRRDQVTRAERALIAHSLGRWLATLHAAPRPDAGSLTGSWPRYVAAEHPRCVARQARWGIPGPVCGEMEALLARSGDLARCDTTLLHADLHDENVLVEQRAGRFVATGVIDFGDAIEGDRLFDLVTPVALVARGDAALVRALFDGAGLGGALADPAVVTRFMALSVLHRWNDLTRVTAWAPHALRSLDALTTALLG